MADGINYTGDLPRYVLDSLFDNLTDKSYWNVDNRNNVDLLWIITHGSNSKCQLTIGIFSIAFAMSVIEKVGKFLNTLTMQYELRYKWWINAVVMILSVPHCLCWLFYFQNIITFLFEKLSCVQILIGSDAVGFLRKSLGMPYSVVTAQQACSTEMVNIVILSETSHMIPWHYAIYHSMLLQPAALPVAFITPEALPVLWPEQATFTLNSPTNSMAFHCSIYEPRAANIVNVTSIILSSAFERAVVSSLNRLRSCSSST